MSELLAFILEFMANVFFWADLRDDPPGSRAITLGCMGVVLAVLLLSVVAFLLTR